MRTLVEALGGALVALVVLARPAGAEPWKLGGDARYYQFLRLDDPGGGRREAELGVFRLKLDGRLGPSLTTEAHGVAAVTSPGTAPSVSIASGTTRRLLELQATVGGDDARATFEIDRLDIVWERGGVRLVAGRQAITWGVSFFWPVLDLFAPFPPERIDREYKPGVDAARAVVSLGRLSQVEAVAAAQGRDLHDDGSLAVLARVNLGPADVGVMAGRFHGDLVAGGFVTANVAGTGLRGEVAFTDSADPYDRTLGRERFWRATAGVDRQLTPTLSLTAEVSWNGFGAREPRDYARVAAADRVRRGEVASLGMLYSGASLTWQAHPLVTVTGTALVNLGDGSVLLLPRAAWSLSDAISLEAGGVFGAGAGRRGDGTPQSEYGPAPSVLYAAIKAYF